MEYVELDPMLRHWGWEIDKLSKMLSDRDRIHYMNRTEAKIYNLELEVLRSKRWAKLRAKVDIGVSNPRDPEPRIVRLLKRSREAWVARAGAYLEWNAARMAPRRVGLKRTVAHELIHYYLMDNACHKGTRSREYSENKYHGRLFRECAGILIDSKANPKVYCYKCSCGWWIEISGKRTENFPCRHCGKRMVPAAEYRSLKKIAEISSKTFRVDLDRYSICTIERRA